MVLQGFCLPGTVRRSDSGIHIHIVTDAAASDGQQVCHTLYVHAGYERWAGCGIGIPGIGVS